MDRIIPHEELNKRSWHRQWIGFLLNFLNTSSNSFSLKWKWIGLLLEQLNTNLLDIPFFVLEIKRVAI